MSILILSILFTIVQANNYPYQPPPHNTYNPPPSSSSSPYRHPQDPRGNYPPPSSSSGYGKNTFPEEEEEVYLPYENHPNNGQEGGALYSPEDPAEAAVSSAIFSAPPGGTSSIGPKQLFGSDLSQIDKDFIFEGLN